MHPSARLLCLVNLFRYGTVFFQYSLEYILLKLMVYHIPSLTNLSFERTPEQDSSRKVLGVFCPGKRGLSPDRRSPNSPYLTIQSLPEQYLPRGHAYCNGLLPSV
jgi:hypothetical protein